MAVCLTVSFPLSSLFSRSALRRAFAKSSGLATGARRQSLRSTRGGFGRKPRRGTSAPKRDGREGSRRGGEDSLADRFPGHRALLRQDILQRRQAITNQVPLPVGTGISPGARLSQSSTTSSMRSCAEKLSASRWIPDLANIVSAYPFHSTRWRHGSGRFGDDGPEEDLRAIAASRHRASASPRTSDPTAALPSGRPISSR